MQMLYYELYYTGRKHHALVPLQPQNKLMYMQMTVTITHCQHIVRYSASIESEWWTDKPDKPVRIRFGSSPASLETAETVLQLFERIVGSHGEHFALAVKRLGEWKTWSYRQYFEQCCTAAKAFVEVRGRGRGRGGEWKVRGGGEEGVAS